MLCMENPRDSTKTTRTDTFSKIVIYNTWKWSRSIVSDSLWPHGLYPTRLLCPWDFPGNSPGMGCHFLLQGIFPTQGSNPGLPHCKQMLHHLSHQGCPVMIDSKSWKMMLWKCCTQYASKLGKLSSGHRTGKGQFSFQSQRKAMPRMLKLPHNCTHLTR